MLITAFSPTLMSSTLTAVVEANLDTLNVALAILAKYISVSANLATTS